MDDLTNACANINLNNASAADDTITDETQLEVTRAPKATDLATNADANFDVLLENAMSVAAEIDDYLTEIKRDPRFTAAMTSEVNPLETIEDKETFFKKIDKFKTLSEEMSYRSEIPVLIKRKEELSSRVKSETAKMEAELAEAEAQLEKLSQEKLILEQELERVKAAEKTSP